MKAFNRGRYSGLNKFNLDFQEEKRGEETVSESGKHGGVFSVDSDPDLDPVCLFNAVENVRAMGNQYTPSRLMIVTTCSIIFYVIVEVISKQLNIIENRKNCDIFFQLKIFRYYG